MSKERPQLPDWARKERISDLLWIQENSEIFWKAATEQYKEQGRGALYIDTTKRPTGKGNPFAYFPQKTVEELDDKDVIRMVKKYDPYTEMVIVLIKSQERTSAYQIQLQKKS
jgi:hypothetical protein